ncbi:MAG: hypothetical protein E2O39_16010 [Planctomycetota bacterium]|nr:MAG: hypothetical protein E2O39_16010 [Planctomycetota bacterium]
MGAVIGLGGRILFLGLECLALLAYAYPGALLLVSVAGGIAPPLAIYWLLHTLVAVEGSWTAWGAYPLLMVGLFGSYHDWRFGRVIATTGRWARAFYRGVGPRASEIFGAPLAIVASIWEVLKFVLGIFRGVVLEVSSLFERRIKPYRERTGTQPQPPPSPKSTTETEGEGGAGE